LRDLSALVFPAARSSRAMVTGPTALPWSATFTGTGRSAWFGESRAASAAVNQPPNPPQGREVEEAAMPGQAASARALPSALWQLPLENCQLPPASPQSSFDRLQRSHVSLPTLSGRMFGGAIKIPPGCVQKLWRMSVPCGSLRKRPGKLWQPKIGRQSVFHNIDGVKGNASNINKGAAEAAPGSKVLACDAGVKTNPSLHP
jgi:hypothetical protein